MKLLIHIITTNKIGDIIHTLLPSMTIQEVDIKNII